MQQDIISVKEAAQRLGIALNQTYQACERGQVPCMRFGRRWLIPRVAFDAWLANCTPTQPNCQSGKGAEE